jgi:hypothetical protein
VIVNDAGATRKLVDGSKSVVIHKRGPADLAARIEECVTMPAAGRFNLVKVSKARVASPATWDRVADAHCDLFRRPTTEQVGKGERR